MRHVARIRRRNDGEGDCSERSEASTNRKSGAGSPPAGISNRHFYVKCFIERSRRPFIKRDTVAVMFNIAGAGTTGIGDNSGTIRNGQD